MRLVNRGSRNILCRVAAMLLPLSIAGTLSAAGATPSSEALLKDAERARGAAKNGIVWEMVLETIENGTSNKIRYTVKSKGGDALIEVTEPAQKKGEMFLFKSNSLWFKKPGLKKPVAMSNRQKLSGNTSNGDIATVNSIADYNNKISGEAMIDGLDTWVVELKAKTKSVTYDGIRLWVTKSDHLAISPSAARSPKRPRPNTKTRSLPTASPCRLSAS